MLVRVTCEVTLPRVLVGGWPLLNVLLLALPIARAAWRHRQQLRAWAARSQRYLERSLGDAWRPRPLASSPGRSGLRAASGR